MIIIFSWIASRYITLDNFKQNKEFLMAYVQEHYSKSILFYSLLYILLVTVATPATALLTMMGGFLFGPWIGTLLAVINATVGSILTFLMVRYSIGKKVSTQYKDQLKQFNQNLTKYGLYYLFFTRIIPLFPFFLINILCGFTTLPLSSFIFATTLGIIPISFVYAYIGYSLESFDFLPKITSKHLILITIICSLLSIPFLINFLAKRKKRLKNISK